MWRTKKTPQYIIFETIGNPSKDIMATAVVSAIKKAYPDHLIVVVTPHTEIWLHNPDVYRISRIDTLNFFHDDFIKDKNSLIFKHDPYHAPDFIYKRKHLIDIWCELCGVKWKGEKPRVYLTRREKEAAQTLFKSNKPIFLTQTSYGGTDMPYPAFWARDLHFKTAQDVIDNYRNSHQIYHIQPENQPVLQGSERLTLSLRQTFAALLISDKRLFIDSILHHSATALDLPSVITWSTLTPEVHGYDIHHNILPKEIPELRRLTQKYIASFHATSIFKGTGNDFNGQPHSAPDILLALSNLKRKQ